MDKLTALLKLADLIGDDGPANTPEQPHERFPWLGAAVAIRTVTHYYTGKAERLVGGFLILSSAAWIADTGRWSAFLAQGTVNEVEPAPDQLAVALGAIVDVAPWGFDLPRTVK